jgi:carbonic anhydrase/acetyltransferase-like protein (isoleucine patch superfamily)
LSCKYVVGAGPELDWAMAAWAAVEPTVALHKITLQQDASYAFDMSVLDEMSVKGATAFVALGSQFLNFRRFELMGLVKSMGFKMPALVCPGAVIVASARIGENSFIGPGALVGVDAEIGFNCVVGAGANIGASTKLGNSAWLASGVVVGTACRIGAHATVGMGVLVRDGVQIGKHCVLDKPGAVVSDVVAKTFHLTSFVDPVVVLGV